MSSCYDDKFYKNLLCGFGSAQHLKKKKKTKADKQSPGLIFAVFYVALF